MYEDSNTEQSQDREDIQLNYRQFTDGFLERFALRFSDAYYAKRFPQHKGGRMSSKMRVYTTLLNCIPQIQEYVATLPKGEKRIVLVEEDIILGSFHFLDKALQEMADRSKPKNLEATVQQQT